MFLVSCCGKKSQLWDVVKKLVFGIAEMYHVKKSFLALL
jgi:hypothetical protein